MCVQERWETIVAWLEAEDHHAVRASFRAPASPEAIASAEKALGLELPADYAAFLAIHDGQKPDAPMVEFCSLLPVDKLAPERAELAKPFGDATFDADDVAPEIAPVAWHERWVPIGRFNRTGLILDLVPASGGTSGQIFVLQTDDDSRSLVASSFGDLLSVYFDQLQDEERRSTGFPAERTRSRTHLAEPFRLPAALGGGLPVGCDHEMEATYGLSRCQRRRRGTTCSTSTRTRTSPGCAATPSRRLHSPLASSSAVSQSATQKGARSMDGSSRRPERTHPITLASRYAVPRRDMPLRMFSGFTFSAIKRGLTSAMRAASRPLRTGCSGVV